jgi:hypothetical protein
MDDGKRLVVLYLKFSFYLLLNEVFDSTYISDILAAIDQSNGRE